MDSQAKWKVWITESSQKALASLQIVVECALYACLLGIAMDQVTAHLAPDYFIMKQPKLTDSREPLILALVWGIGASWWFGAIAGALLAVQNWLRKPPLAVPEIRTRIIKACPLIWLILMAMLGIFFLLIGLLPEEARRPTFDFDRHMMAVALTHLTEYVVGAAALVVVMVKLKRLPSGPTDASVI